MIMISTVLSILYHHSLDQPCVCKPMIGGFFQLSFLVCLLSLLEVPHHKPIQRRQGENAPPVFKITQLSGECGLTPECELRPFKPLALKRSRRWVHVPRLKVLFAKGFELSNPSFFQVGGAGLHSQISSAVFCTVYFPCEFVVFLAVPTFCLPTHCQKKAHR